MKEEVLFRYYNLFKNLRTVHDATLDIEFINDELTDFDRDSAIGTCSHLALKYESLINRIGNLINGLSVIRDMGLYRQKRDDEVYEDLEYVRNCIVIYATVKSGLEPDYLTCVRKVA